MDESIDDCLRKAGCSQELCRCAAKLSESGRAHELLPQLAEHRLDLLAELHEADERLACLDQTIAEIRAGR